MNYQETEQKEMLRKMDRNLPAMVAVDPVSGAFEVIYSDGAYREFGNRFRGPDFFASWNRTGIAQIDAADRERLRAEITRERLQKVLSTQEAYITRCRFLVQGTPAWCEIRIIQNPVEPNTVVLGIRNTDAAFRQEMKHSVRQMHPHFLYNALGSIREIVLTDPEYGAELLYDFTTYLRASIRAMSNDDRIWFSQEAENIRAYVNIEQIRFGDRLRVEYAFDAADFQILPLSVQPIVENAIKHGIYEKAGSGTVRICTKDLPDAWEICVTDDGVGFDPKRIREEVLAGKRDSTGLENLIFRLENLMQAEVRIESQIGKGTAVTIRIPKEFRKC